MTLTFNPIDPKIESNGPRIINNHPTEFHAIRFNTFWVMRVTRIQIHFECEGNYGNLSILYLSDSVQISIIYHYDPDILSLVLSDTGCKKTTEQDHFLFKPIYELSLTIDIRARAYIPRHATPLGAEPPLSLNPTNGPACRHQVENESLSHTTTVKHHLGYHCFIKRR